MDSRLFSCVADVASPAAGNQRQVDEGSSDVALCKLAASARIAQQTRYGEVMSIVIKHNTHMAADERSMQLPSRTLRV